MAEERSLPNLCHIVEVESGLTVGLMSIYVDDVLLAGEEEVIHSARARMHGGNWKLSPAERATSEVQLRFCGFEIYKKDDGYLINQKAFAEDLTAKWGIEESTEKLTYKLPDEESEDGTPEEVKEAQAITGALLWLAAKTRPDITVAVVAMSRWTKKGKQVVKIGKDPGDVLRPSSCLFLAHHLRVLALAEQVEGGQEGEGATEERGGGPQVACTESTRIGPNRPYPKLLLVLRCSVIFLKLETCQERDSLVGPESSDNPQLCDSNS